MPAENEFIGKFRLIRKLGEGGMGTVFLAQDQRVKPPRMVAIKMLKDNSTELRERFGREVGIIANFEHPNIVHVFEVDEHEGHPFMAMAYVKGETLLEMIRRKAPMPLIRKLQIIEHLCAGLAYAHRQGVVHRDIKPGNVMVDSEETLKILDFGIARLADSTLTVSGSIIGTPNYMSPEQIMGEPIGPPSDIFAVGCLAYEILAYQQAFPGKIPEVLGRIQYAEPVPLRDTSAAIDGPVAEIIARALKKNPAERYQDLTEMQRDLARVRKRLEETSEEKTLVEPRKRSAQIEPMLAAAREALSAGDFLAARTRAAEVLELDTRNSDALAIDRSAHEGMLERQNKEWLEKAREFFAAENLTGADELLQQVVRQTPNQPDAMKLRAEIASRRQRQEEEIAQKRAIARTLARARTNIAEGAYEAALRALDEIFAVAPNQSDALKLAEEAKAGAAGRDSQTDDERAPQISEARKQAIADCLEAGLSAAAAGRLEEAAKELAEIRGIDPQSEAAGRLSQKIDAEREVIARRQRVDTIRMDVQKAIQARNVDLAERLTKELAASGADAREIDDLRTRLLTVRQEATLVSPPAFASRGAQTPAPQTPPSTDRKILSEGDKMARAGLRAFFHGEYSKALDVLERIPKTAAGTVPRERVVFYMACSNAAIALLEGDKGAGRMDKARKLFQLAQPEKNPFALDRQYISPEILSVIEGKAAKVD